MNAVIVLENKDNEEKAASNVKNIDIEDNHEHKMKNNDEKNLNSSEEYIDISKYPSSNLENINIEENLVKKFENIEIEEILTSRIEIIDEENPASNVKIIDSEDNWVDIEHNCVAEETNGHDMGCTCMEDLDVQEKIARFIITISRFKDDFKSSLHKFRGIKELFQTNCFNREYMSSENGQLFMALMQKIDISIYFIQIELSHWDRIDDLTPKEMFTVITHPAFEYRKNRFPQIYKALSKVMKYFRKIEELEKKI